MNTFANPRAVFRWVFLAFGLFIVVRADLVLNTAQQLSTYIVSSYPSDKYIQAALIIAVLSGPMLAGVILLISSLGMAGRSSWPRWSALAAFILMLPGFPWFTVAGVIGALLVLTIPLKTSAPIAKASEEGTHGIEDYWERAKNSKAQKIILFASGTLLILGLNGATWLATRIGLPEWNMTWHWWLWLLALLLANTAIHEVGHIFMAWTLHHEFRLLTVGPLTITNGRYGYTVQIHWGRLLETGGYMGSVPRVKSHIRLQEVVVIAAGPTASLVVGLLSLGILLSLPGASWESNWELIAMNGVIAFNYVLISAIPFGYTDGSMMFHLLLRTKPGELLLSRCLAAQAEIEAEALLGAANYERLVEFRDIQLSEAQRHVSDHSLLLALNYQQSGYARTAIGDWPTAEDHVRKCLAMEAECAAVPAMKANARTFLHLACVARHNLLEAEQLYPNALKALEAIREGRDSIGSATNRAMVAELNQHAGRWAESLSAAEEGLRYLPSGNARLPLRVLLLSSKAYAEVLSGLVGQGIESAEQAIDIVRSGRIESRDSNVSWSRIGELGHLMWRAGQSEFAIQILNEAIGRLIAVSAEVAAIRLRVKLACIFRSLGRYREAEPLLEVGSSLNTIIMRESLIERVRLYLATKRFEEAICDCKQLLSIWGAVPGCELSVVKCVWARACIQVDDSVSAKRFCCEALPQLESCRHIEAASCRVTLLISEGHETRDVSSAWSREVLAQIDADPLLTEPERLRLIREEAVFLDLFGFTDQSRIFKGRAESRPNALELNPSMLANA